MHSVVCMLRCRVVLYQHAHAHLLGARIVILRSLLWARLSGRACATLRSTYSYTDDAGVYSLWIM